MELSGTTALIPGASRPVGRAIAKRFADAGCRLILPVFDWPESIAEMENDFRQRNYAFSTCQLDLRNKSAVEEFAQTLRAEGTILTYLINNIERGGMPILHGSYDHAHNDGQWELEIATTLTSKWLLYHNLYPLMAQQNGAVVNISSVAGELGRSGSTAVFFNDGYSAANRGIQLFTETWAREAAPHIRVNELALGLVQGRHGEGTRGWSLLSDEEQEQVRQAPLLKRTCTPEEVADAVFWLAVKATYLTGTVVRMDGGLCLSSRDVPSMPPGRL